MGDRKLRSHQVKLALATFRKAAELEPENLRTTFQVAWCLYKLGEYRAAVDAYDRVLQKTPVSALTHAYREAGLGRGSANSGGH